MGIFALLVVIVVIEKSNSQMLSTSKNCFSTGDSLTLHCKTTDFTEVINFNLNTGSQGSCIPTIPCDTGLSQSGTTTSITFTSFNELTHGGNWTCTYGSATSAVLILAETHCQSSTKRKKQLETGAASQGGSDGGGTVIIIAVDKLTKHPRFTSRVVRQWYFSSRYVFRGRVVYGIQVLIVAAFTQVLVIIPTVVVFVVCAEQMELDVKVILPLLMLVWPALSVVIYLLYKAFFFQKVWTQTEFKDELMHRSLSDDYGIQFDTINKDRIWFKVWARDDVLMTLYGNEKKPFLNIIIGRDDRLRNVIIDSKSTIPIVDCNNVLNTSKDEYRIFYLTCEEHDVTVVRVLNGKEDIVLEWTDTNGSETLDSVSKPLDISDIRISNYMRDLEDTETQTGTRGDWIFFIRQGDRLYEDEDDARLSKTLKLVLVVAIPCAWLVLLILYLKKSLIPKGPLEMKYISIPKGSLEMTYLHYDDNANNGIVNLFWKAPPMYSVKDYQVEKFYNELIGWTTAGYSKEPNYSDQITGSIRNSESARYRVKARFSRFVSQPLEAEEFIAFVIPDRQGPLEFADVVVNGSDVTTIKWAPSIGDNIVRYRIETRQNDWADWNVLKDLRTQGNTNPQQFTHSALRSASQMSVRTWYLNGFGNRLIGQRPA